MRRFPEIRISILRLYVFSGFSSSPDLCSISLSSLCVTSQTDKIQPSGVSWIKHLARLNSSVIEYNDAFYRARLQSLQAVDELIEGLVTRLDKYNILENTYIIYTTDNGYHISQHRLPPGKECGFEEDIHIPLYIRGPGVPKAAEADVVTAHTDLAPTILRIAEGDWQKDDLDGSPIPVSKEEIKEAVRAGREHVNVEFWGRSLSEGDYGFSLDDGKVGKSLCTSSELAKTLLTFNSELWCEQHV